jgi:hypothetical protein
LVRLSQIGEVTRIGVVLIRSESGVASDERDMAELVDLIPASDTEAPSLPLGLPGALIPPASELLESTEIPGKYVAARLEVDSTADEISAHIANVVQQFYGAEVSLEEIDESGVLVSWSAGGLRGAAMAVDGDPATLFIVIEP